MPIKKKDKHKNHFFMPAFIDFRHKDDIIDALMANKTFNYVHCVGIGKEYYFWLKTLFLEHYKDTGKKPKQVNIQKGLKRVIRDFEKNYIDDIYGK